MAQSVHRLYTLSLIYPFLLVSPLSSDIITPLYLQDNETISTKPTSMGTMLDAPIDRSVVR